MNKYCPFFFLLYFIQTLSFAQHKKAFVKNTPEIICSDFNIKLSKETCLLLKNYFEIWKRRDSLGIEKSYTLDDTVIATFKHLLERADFHKPEIISLFKQKEKQYAGINLIDKKASRDNHFEIYSHEGLITDGMIQRVNFLCFKNSTDTTSYFVEALLSQKNSMNKYLSIDLSGIEFIDAVENKQHYLIYGTYYMCNADPCVSNVIEIFQMNKKIEINLSIEIFHKGQEPINFSYDSVSKTLFYDYVEYIDENKSSFKEEQMQY